MQVVAADEGAAWAVDPHDQRLDAVVVPGRGQRLATFFVADDDALDVERRDAIAAAAQQVAEARGVCDRDDGDRRRERRGAPPKHDATGQAAAFDDRFRRHGHDCAVPLDAVAGRRLVGAAVVLLPVAERRAQDVAQARARVGRTVLRHRFLLLGDFVRLD